MSTRLGGGSFEWGSGLVHAAADGRSPRSAFGSSRCGTRPKVGLPGMTSRREFLSPSDEEGLDQPVATVRRGQGFGFYRAFAVSMAMRKSPLVAE